MPDRITNGYCAGRGDVGFSQLLEGDSIRKDDPACSIYSYLEHLANTIAELLSEHVIYDRELQTVLEYILTNHFSISSFCFKKGNTSDHVLPENFLLFLEFAVEKYKEEIGNSEDFLIQDNKKAVVIDRIRIWSRDVERAYVTWKNHERVTSNLLSTLLEDADKAQTIYRDMVLVGQILNRLSTYIWWATRNEKLLMRANGDASLIIGEKCWQGKVLEFDWSAVCN